MSFSFPTTAAEPAGYRHSLFNGQDLDGWIATGSQAEARDGALILKGGIGWLRTHQRYGDFVLELNWRTRPDSPADCGIIFRAELPPAGQSQPERHHISLRPGQEGALAGRLETGPDTPGSGSGRVPHRRLLGRLAGLGHGRAVRQVAGPQTPPPAAIAADSRLVRPGQWNHFKLTVVGGDAALEINGQPAWRRSGLEPRDGYLGLQASLPNGGPIEFKDVFVTELGYRSLFTGTDLSGWEGATADAATCWKADAGLLVCTGQTGTWLRSVEQFGDFNLRLEYKVRPGGNSGVYIRVPQDGNHHGPGSGVEVQILDDASERYGTLKPYQFSASLYAVLAAEPRVARQAGEWNTLEINCRARTYRITHNGVPVLNTDETATPELKQRLVSGHLGLQNHNEEVWFRKLRLGPPQ